MSLGPRCCLLMALLGACASAAPKGAGSAAPASLPGRVAAILARRHISPPASSASLSTRLFDHVRSALDCRTPLSPGHEAERAGALAALVHGDLAFVTRAGTECGAAPLPRARQLALALNALARSYDPHSRYLTPEALVRFHAQTRASGNDAPSTKHALIEHTGRRIGLVSLPSFYLRASSSASADLRRACIELRARGAEVLVLDLRGNGGGVQREAVLAFGVLSGGGPVALVRRRDRTPEVLEAPADLKVWSGPLLVRVDGGTASVAELLAAALQDHGRALIIGQRTYGKGTGQTLVHLNSPDDLRDGAVDVTDRRFYRVDGYAMQRDGVIPDIILPAPAIASERTRPGALVPDEVSPLQPARKFQAPRAQAEREALDAAADYVKQSLAR